MDMSSLFQQVNSPLGHGVSYVVLGMVLRHFLPTLYAKATEWIKSALALGYKKMLGLSSSIDLGSMPPQQAALARTGIQRVTVGMINIQEAVLSTPGMGAKKKANVLAWLKKLGVAEVDLQTLSKFIDDTVAASAAAAHAAGEEGEATLTPTENASAK